MLDAEELAQKLHESYEAACMHCRLPSSREPWEWMISEDNPDHRRAQVWYWMAEVLLEWIESLAAESEEEDGSSAEC